jgi:nickel-dependent lactate racemase
MSSTLSLRTGAWYGDRLIELEIPPYWDVNIVRPNTPVPLTKKQIEINLLNPTGQDSIKNLCKGKSRPLIIIDDLNRPTPTNLIIEILLDWFEHASIPLKDVTILMATGSHGKPAQDAFPKKVGEKAAKSCRLLVHDCFSSNKKVGKTSFGTNIYANPALLSSDFVLGIGGIYPNWTAGFGGGTKLALGVLGIQSIFDLHFQHQGIGWGNEGSDDCSFRKDLNEVAHMIGLDTAVSVQVNANREIIRVDSGDPTKFYPDATNFCRQTFGFPASDDADVVISDTYPNDLSLTFAKMKGFAPFELSKPTASKIAIASCGEGIGLHNIFPFINMPRFQKEKHFIRLLRAFGIKWVSTKILKRLWRVTSQPTNQSPSPQKPANNRSILLYRPDKNLNNLPSNIPGITQLQKWADIIQTVRKEQQSRDRVKVSVYPCAFLQFPNPPQQNPE